MNPPLTQAQAITQLSLLTSQTSPANFTFTSDELTQAMQTAWNDTYVCKPVYDSSLSYTVGTYQYTLPATVTTVKEIYIKKTSNQYPQRINPSMYEVINGVITFNEGVEKWLYDTFTLYLKGLYKLASTDSLTTDELVNYTIWRATEILLQNLLFKKVFYFLKTDTTVRDIVAAQQQAQAQVLRYKQALLREFESA